MSTKDNVTPEVRRTVIKRDRLCVYCGKEMIYPYRRDRHNDSSTLEHFKEGPLNRESPFEPKDVGMCCGLCNSKRGEKRLSTWFQDEYCKKGNINENTVAQPVKEYIRGNLEY